MPLAKVGIELLLAAFVISQLLVPALFGGRYCWLFRKRQKLVAAIDEQEEQAVELDLQDELERVSALNVAKKKGEEKDNVRTDGSTHGPGYQF